MYKSRIKNINCNTSRFKPLFDFFSTKSAEYNKKLYPFLIGLLILACITIFSIWGIKNLWHSLTNLNIFKLSPSTFSFNIPTWVTDRFSNDIKYVSSLNQCYSMYEYNLTQEIAAAYSKITPINKIDAIKRVYPNKLNIKLILRTPAALVKYRNNVYLVDYDCVLLPKEYYKLPNNEYDNPCIQSNKLTKPPLLGNTWNDNGIKAGVELLKFLRANNVHNIFKILVIDVSNVCRKRNTGKSDIILWTENNTQIRWGCSSLCNEPNELSDEEKLQNLLSIAKSEGTNLKRMDYVDVRWKRPVGKQWVGIKKTFAE